MSEIAKGHLAMLLFSGLVAGSFSLGGMAANHIDPVALNIARFLVAALIVGAFTMVTQGITRASLNAPWRYLVLGGVFATYFVLMFYGLKTAPPVSAAAVFTLTPLMAGVAGWLILRQITTPYMALALAIGATGALWVIFRADIVALLQFRVGSGEIVYFWGCVAHAVYIPLVRLLNRGESAMIFTFWTLVAGMILMVVWGGWTLVETDWSNLPEIVWVALIYISVFATAITFILVQFATLRLPAAKVMAYTYLTPSWVILWEIALGHGAPPVWILGGVTLTIVALLMLLRQESQPLPKTAPRA